MKRIDNVKSLVKGKTYSIYYNVPYFQGIIDYIYVDYGQFHKISKKFDKMIVSRRNEHCFIPVHFKALVFEDYRYSIEEELNGDEMLVRMATINEEIQNKNTSRFEDVSEYVNHLPLFNSPNTIKEYSLLDYYYFLTNKLHYTMISQLMLTNKEVNELIESNHFFEVKSADIKALRDYEVNTIIQMENILRSFTSDIRLYNTLRTNYPVISEKYINIIPLKSKFDGMSIASMFLYYINHVEEFTSINPEFTEEILYLIRKFGM